MYDPTDANDDGVPDNPGNILYYQENYSGNKDSLGLNFGFALTFNIPLDNRFQDSCLDAANTQINLQKQELNAKLLNYEIARLKNCGALMLKGIYFDPKSNFAKLCEGVIVQPPPNQVIPHTHKFKSNWRLGVLSLTSSHYGATHKTDAYVLFYIFFLLCQLLY